MEILRFMFSDLKHYVGMMILIVVLISPAFRKTIHQNVYMIPKDTSDGGIGKHNERGDNK